jgi:predicted nucleic acid-binding protein
MTFPAFFDTNVLYGALLNDVVLWLADRGLFRPLWSDEVLEELTRNLIRNGQPLALVDKRISTMRGYFPDALVDGYQELIPGLKCHPKDRHVLAAAVRANAAVLVTFNLKDFPTSALDAFDIEVVHPDDFLLDQLDLYPGPTVAVIQNLVETYNSPEMNLEDILRALGTAEVPKFARAVATHFA